jgi:hypothetical protein
LSSTKNVRVSVSPMESTHCNHHAVGVTMLRGRMPGGVAVRKHADAFIFKSHPVFIGLVSTGSSAMDGKSATQAAGPEDSHSAGAADAIAPWPP